jgi:hypothetical protein
VVGVDRSARHIEHARTRAAQAGFAPDQLCFEAADLREVDLVDGEPYNVAVIVLALHEMPTTARRSVLDRLSAVAEQVMIVDFAAPLRWNLPGLKKRAMELAAGSSHHAAFRDYIAHGGINGIVAPGAVTVTADRTIDNGTLRVVTVTAGPGRPDQPTVPVSG